MSRMSTYSIDGPVCPYCRYQRHPEGADGDYDEGTTEMTCGACDRDFAVYIHVSHSWTTRPIPQSDIETEAEQQVGMEPNT